MARIVAVTACPTGVAHTYMAAEALQKTAESMGHTISVETQGSIGVENGLSNQAIAAADVVVLATDIKLNTSRFAGKPVYETRTSEAIRATRAVLEGALALIKPSSAPAQADEPAARQAVQPVTVAAEPAAQPAAATPEPAAATTPQESQPTAPAAAGGGGKKLVGITSCPTGIAHTFMAAEALQKAAKNLGHTIKVETQGSVGAKNQLTDDDIAAADAVVIAADTKVDISRFAGKPVYTTGTKQAMHNGQEVIRTALEQPAADPGSATYAEAVKQAKSSRSESRAGPYKHLMTGVSYMLPLVVAGGLSIALAFTVGGIDAEGPLAEALMLIGGGTAFSLFVAVFSAFIAFSIADRPGIAPGLIGGMLAQSLGAGFLGGIVSGFMAGYFTLFLANRIKLPANLEGLKPVLILPFLSSVVIGLLMIFVVGPPVQVALNALTAWLQGLQGANAAVLGIILGLMMAFDMGGPVNKAAYTFAVGLLASNVSEPMAAVMAAGMTPPLGLALAGYLFKDRFDVEERQARGPALVLGVSFITEGAIPFAAKDPLRVIPSLMIGSAIAGGMSLMWGIELLVPHGGIFAMVIPGAVSNLLMYFVAIVAGALATTGALFFLKRPLSPQVEVAKVSDEQMVTA